jgi:hypothetical protein
MGLDQMFLKRTKEGDEEKLGTLRKANAIHAFVEDNCYTGDGDMNCEYIPMKVEDLENLLDRCIEVINNPSEGPNLLPTRGGFFFGSTEYDEYYLEDIQSTADIVAKILSQKEDGYLPHPVYYHSWF